MAVCQNIEIFRNGTPKYLMCFKQKGQIVDITGWTIYLTVKQNMSDTDANASLRKEITSHIDAEHGKTLIELTSDDTDLKGNYYYSIDYKTPDGDEDVLFYGRIKFKDTVLDNR